jgi:hypothetical protein
MPTSDFLQLNQCAQNSTEIIHKTIQAQLVYMEMKTADNAGYVPLLAKAKIIAQLTENVYDSIALFQQQIDFLSLEIAAKKEHLVMFQSLLQKAQHLQRQSIALIYKSWDNGGIKATIFADSTKRKTSMQYIKTTLSPITPPEWTIISPSINSILQIQIGRLQQQVKQNEAVFINFFASQFGKMTLCGPREFMAINSPKSCIRLGETYEAAFTLLLQMPHDNYEVRIGDSLLNRRYDRSPIYNIPSKTKGEQCFWTSVMIVDPFTKEQTILHKPFYFEVTR